jgi:G protein beta subunit-like protein
MATTSSDSTIKIWSIKAPSTATANAAVTLNAGGNNNWSIQLERVLAGHQRWVWDCAFSADSEYLVSASSDHTARLWDLSNGEVIRQYQGHQKAAVCVALNDYSL